jgi:hypothetical protein
METLLADRVHGLHPPQMVNDGVSRNGNVRTFTVDVKGKKEKTVASRQYQLLQY